MQFRLRGLLIGCRLSWLFAATDRDLAAETLSGGLTSVRFKQDIMRLFRSEKYAARAALDIGAGGGTTTAALAVNFAVVVAMEKFWTLAWPNPGPTGYHINSDKLLRKDGSRISNIVRLHVDTDLLGSFSTLADQNFSVAVIDAEHKSSTVARDTFNVLRALPCCVDTIIYHDYCDADVFRAIQWFVDEGLLTFYSPVGERNWWQWWCRDGRPEGAAMRVLRHRGNNFHNRVEQLYKRLSGWRGSLQNTLNASRWLLLATDTSDMSVLQLCFWPSLSHVSDVSAVRPDGSPVRSQPLKAGFAKPVPGDTQMLSLVSRNRNRRRQEVLAELDRDLRLMRLHVPKDHPLRAHCRPGCMGINLRWSVGWASQIDHLLHVDQSLVEAAARSLRAITSFWPLLRCMDTCMLASPPSFTAVMLKRQ